MTDLVRDYRVCHFNHQAHGGPHLHAPIGARASLPLPLRSCAEAEALVRAYAARHPSFSARTFQEQAKAWRSASKSA